MDNMINIEERPRYIALTPLEVRIFTLELNRYFYAT